MPRASLGMVQLLRGDEGESHHFRDEQTQSDHSRDSSVEYIETIRRSERILSRLPDQVLLSILGAKVQHSSLCWEPGSSRSSSSSSSGAMLESWLPSELRSDGMSRRISLKKLAQLKKNEALAKGKAIEEYKSSNDFHKPMESVASKYFGEGFDFCKRQLAHHQPNLGIDLDGMGLDHDLLE
ncbi:hypothetical protein Acr_00g0029460 [Actinidia rufa]|uniref:Uncharacterized protein n=1 Tax=Actinidia rufa TaxID=165716 RepID=A0A7J0DEI3_9ERIC|nr:hypothetical protein Acr_00g0029460 [Actinidia rufa]